MKKFDQDIACNKEKTRELSISTHEIKQASPQIPCSLIYSPSPHQHHDLICRRRIEDVAQSRQKQSEDNDSLLPVAEESGKEREERTAGPLCRERERERRERERVNFWAIPPSIVREM